MISFLRGGALYLTLIMAATLGHAVELPPEKIASLHSELKSQDAQSQVAALNELKALDSVPDEFVPDLLAIYEANMTPSPEDDFKKVPPTSQAEALARLKVLANAVAENQLLQSIWAKTDSKVVAQAIRPVLADPAKRTLVMEIPSFNKEIAGELLPDLLILLKDPNSSDDANYFTCRALEAIGPAAKEAVPTLLDKLSSPADRVRDAAIRALAAIGVTDPTAIPILVKGTADSSATVSMTCGDLLKKLNYDPSKQIKPLLDALNGKFNYQAIDALQAVGPTVIGEVKTHAATVPFSCVDDHLSVIHTFKSKAAAAFVGDLNSGNVNLRYMAVSLMADFPDQSHQGIDWLTPYLTDPDKNVRILALNDWVHAQKDSARRLSLIQKSLGDPDLRDTAVDLAGDEGADAKPMLPTIKEAIAQLTDETTKINYLTDACVIDQADSAPLEQLLAYVRGPNGELCSLALSNLYFNHELRKRADPLVQKIYEDPNTSSSIRIAIETAREEAKRADDTSKSQ